LIISGVNAIIKFGVINMEFLTDIIYTNRSIAKKAFKSLYKNWQLIFTGIFYVTATIVISNLLSFFWILAGLVMIIVSSALISNYLYLLDCIIKRDRLTWHDFKDGFGIYLRKVWGILFIGWVASFGFTSFVLPILSVGLPGHTLSLLINFLLLLILNPLPETVYQKYYNPWESVTYTFGFIKENWLEWYVPNLVFMGVLYILTGNFLMGTFNTYVFSVVSFFSYRGILFFILGQVVFSYMMIYRGYLYELLSTSTRRKRIFMRKF